MSNLKVGQRVRYTASTTYSHGQVGTLLDLPTVKCQVVAVRFDDGRYNDAIAVEIGHQPCSACLYSNLEPIED